MILADGDIVQAQRLGFIRIDPWKDDFVQPVSYDLGLAPYVRFQEHFRQENGDGDLVVDEVVWVKEKFREHDLSYTVEPDEFVLMSTIETVTIGNNHVGHVVGKSTWARHGLLVEAAGLVDPGFTGQLTLEVKNLSKFPVKLYAGQRIAQITFSQTRSKVLKPYGQRGNHYQGQEGPTPPWE